MKSLKPLFNPSSIAIVGASRTPHKVGHQILKNLIRDGFGGNLYPVNPNASTILNHRCYPSLSSLPRVPDLVIVVTPSVLVSSIIKEAENLGVKSAIIITAGFSEIGAKGQKLQSDLQQVLTSNSISVVGPNSLGLINPVAKVNASFGPSLPSTGNIFLISQSGALITSIFDWAATHHVGFTGAVSLGNRLGITENDLLTWAERDSRTKVIAVYLESFSNPQQFFSLAAKISATKPIVLLTGGVSSFGQKASASHTAALATDTVLLKAIAAQTGVVVTPSIESWLSTIQLAARFPVKFPVSISIITNAGGPAVVASDHAAYYHLNVPEPTPAVIQQLRVMGYDSFQNPFDVLGDATPDKIASVTSVFMQDNSGRGVLVIVTPQSMTQPVKTAKMLTVIKNPHHKPVMYCFMGGAQMKPAISVLKNDNHIHFSFPNDALEAYAHLAKYSSYAEKPSTFPSSVKTLNKENVYQCEKILEKPSLRAYLNLLRMVNIKIPKTIIVNNLDAVPDALHEVGKPAVIKTAHPHLAHKKGVGGVMLDVMTSVEARFGFRKISKLYPEVLFQQTIHTDYEVIIGARRDASFGPFLTVGLGGSLTNLIADRQYAFLPCDQKTLQRTLMATKAFQYLKSSDCQIQPIIEVMHAVQILMLSLPSIIELEINPLLVTSRSVYAADIKLTLAPSEFVGAQKVV